MLTVARMDQLWPAEPPRTAFRFSAVGCGTAPPSRLSLPNNDADCSRQSLAKSCEAEGRKWRHVAAIDGGSLTRCRSRPPPWVDWKTQLLVGRFRVMSEQLSARDSKCYGRSSVDTNLPTNHVGTLLAQAEGKTSAMPHYIAFGNSWLRRHWKCRLVHTNQPSMPTNRRYYHTQHVQPISIVSNQLSDNDCSSLSIYITSCLYMDTPTQYIHTHHLTVQPYYQP